MDGLRIVHHGERETTMPDKSLVLTEVQQKALKEGLVSLIRRGEGQGGANIAEYRQILRMLVGEQQVVRVPEHCMEGDTEV
ncbi:MAG: hypothetical protein WAX38_00565 [Minisyncoccia bacterium]